MDENYDYQLKRYENNDSIYKKFDEEFLKTEEGLVQYYWDRKGIDNDDLWTISLTVPFYDLGVYKLEGINQIIESIDFLDELYYEYYQFPFDADFDMYKLMRISKFFPVAQQKLNKYKEYLANKDFSLFEKFTAYRKDKLLDEYLKPINSYENGKKTPTKMKAAKLRFQEIKIDYYEQFARAMLGLIPFENLQQYLKFHPIFALCHRGNVDAICVLTNHFTLLNRIDPNSPLENEYQIIMQAQKLFSWWVLQMHYFTRTNTCNVYSFFY